MFQSTHATLHEPGRASLAAVAPPESGGINHVLASASVADERTLVLKHGDTFGVFDHFGDIKPGGLGEEGLYHEGTRYLSCLLLTLEGNRPFFLSSTIRDENDQLAVTLTNPDLVQDDCVVAPLGNLHIAIKRFLWNATLYQQLRIKNHGLKDVHVGLSLYFKADYADIFEVRGMQRPARGDDLLPQVNGDEVLLGYRGLDDCERHTLLKFSPTPSRLANTSAWFDVSLPPQQETLLTMTVACQRAGAAPPILSFDEARGQFESHIERAKAWACHLHSTNGQVNAWLKRAEADLLMMTTELDTGPYPYAGVPWFNTPFGRDGIITALECLWLRPGIAKGVLEFLASTQATAVIPEQDAEPGKILHETRHGEMAALKEMPFGKYYGSVDSTPLFVLLAGAYYERTGECELIKSLWPNVEAALRWIEEFGDQDGDGFVEYHRRTPSGLVHQGWKDSDDSVFHADGTLAVGPIALCEVQGYVYAAWRAGASLASVLGHHERAEMLSRQADTLKQRFADSFWSDELGMYAIALDGEKRPCLVRSSNAGQCLFTGIAMHEHARVMAPTLVGPAFFSGFGVRTVASSEARYNPMAYHNGSVWPHDNALIAQGLTRYGFGDMASQIWAGQFHAGTYFDLDRMPELFCGFAQAPGEGPVLYPVACSPQAWSAASVFLMFQACLGMSISAPDRQISFTRPNLPLAVGDLRIHHLQVGQASVDLHLTRHDQSIGVNVLRREGDVQILVVK